MAIIKYTLVDGRVPSGLSSSGDFHSPVDETYIGIGSGVGTEISIDELKTWLKAIKSVINIRHQEWDNEIRALASLEPTLDRPATDAEIETMVDDWCTARGIS